MHDYVEEGACSVEWEVHTTYYTYTRTYTYNIHIPSGQTTSVHKYTFIYIPTTRMLVHHTREHLHVHVSTTMAGDPTIGPRAQPGNKMR